MEPSHTAFDIPAEDLQTIGGMILIYGHIDDSLNRVLTIMRSGGWQVDENGEEFMPMPVDAWNINNGGPKIAEIRKRAANSGDPILQGLVKEFRLALVKANRARNYLAHGVVLGTPGHQVLWSLRRRKHISLDEALAAKPWFSYANIAILLIQWRLLGIEPPVSLPERPA